MRITPDRKLGNLEYSWARLDAYAPINFVAALHLQNGPDPKVLRQALDFIQTQHSLMNVSVVSEGRAFRFHRHDPADPVPLDNIARDGDDDWPPVVERELATPFAAGTAPLARCTYLHGPQRSELVLCFHHAIIDSRSGEALFGQILQTCADIQAGKPPAGKPTNDALMPPLDDLFPRGFRGFAKARQIASFLTRQMGTELRYRRALGDLQKVDGDAAASCRILTLELSRDETRQLTRATRKRRLPVNSVLHAAMLMALARSQYPNTALPMRGITFADLRPYLDPPLPGNRMGVYISMLLYMQKITPADDVWSLAGAISAQIYRAAKTGDKFAAALFSKHLISLFLRRKSMRLGMVALSYPGPLTLAPTYGDIAMTGLSGFIANNPLGPELAGFAKILHGRLGLDLLYLETDMDRQTATAILADIRQTLLTEGQAPDDT